MSQPMSIFIPRVFDNITKQFVIDTFHKLLLGEVSHVDFVAKLSNNGETYNAVYVHFHKWYDNIASENFRIRAADAEKEARIVYDEPWYWICLENKAVKHNSSQPKVRIDLTHFHKEVASIQNMEQEDTQWMDEIDEIIEKEENQQTDAWNMMVEDLNQHHNNEVDYYCQTVDANYAWILEQTIVRLQNEIYYLRNPNF